MIRLYGPAVAPLLALAMASPVAAAPIEVATAQPLAAVEQCLRGQFADTGRITAINTAGGVMLAMAFDTVGADGKVATGRLTFSIEDQGAQRRVTASAPNASDDALAGQMLAQAVRKCLPDAAAHRADAPPPSLIEKQR